MVPKPISTIGVATLIVAIGAAGPVRRGTGLWGGTAMATSGMH
jgi:hypothetical protein